MRSLKQRANEFLQAPLPGEIALNHNPDSLTEVFIRSYASGGAMDGGLVRMGKVCLAEMDTAIASVHSEQAKLYFVECRRLLEEILLETS
jgi:hypothetical protein